VNIGVLNSAHHGGLYVRWVTANGEKPPKSISFLFLSFLFSHWSKAANRAIGKIPFKMSWFPPSTISSLQQTLMSGHKCTYGYVDTLKSFLFVCNG